MECFSTDVISSSTTIVGYLTVFTDDIFVKCKNGGEKVMPPTASARLSSWVWNLIPTTTKPTYVSQSVALRKSIAPQLEDRCVTLVIIKFRDLFNKPPIISSAVRFNLVLTKSTKLTKSGAESNCPIISFCMASSIEYFKS